jgi:hypothetical protein
VISDSKRYTAMKCPYCSKEFHSQLKGALLQAKCDAEAFTSRTWTAWSQLTPCCGELIVFLVEQLEISGEIWERSGRTQIYPPSTTWPDLPAEVPAAIAKDYLEAAAVLRISPNASAALSRRCLQQLLHDVAKIEKQNLEQEIDEAIRSAPHRLAKLLDAVRVLGNFAAHPTKSTNTGEIIEVKPGEAELLLHTLDMAFQHYVIKSTLEERFRDSTNQMLKEAGKPPLK